MDEQPGSTNYFRKRIGTLVKKLEQAELKLAAQEQFLAGAIAIGGKLTGDLKEAEERIAALTAEVDLWKARAESTQQLTVEQQNHLAEADIRLTRAREQAAEWQRMFTQAEIRMRVAEDKLADHERFGKLEENVIKAAVEAELIRRELPSVARMNPVSRPERLHDAEATLGHALDDLIMARWETIHAPPIKSTPTVPLAPTAHKAVDSAEIRNPATGTE